MLIILYITILLLSAGIAVLAAEYQWCYRSEQKFLISDIPGHFRRSPLIFIAFVLLFLAASGILIWQYQNMGLTVIKLPQYLLMWEGMLVGAWIDLQTKKIPNFIFLVLLSIRVVGLFAEMIYASEIMISDLLDSLIGMIIGGLIVLICRFLSRGGVGAGDVKLFAIIGLYFGIIPSMNIFFYTTFIAAAGAAVLLVSKKAKLKSTLAFGPFAFIGLNIYYILLMRY